MDGVEVIETVEQRRAPAGAGARAANEELEAKGVRALIFGSLAKGTFGRWSDVDIMVTRCPDDLRYAIEGIVEDHLLDIPFDVVYVDEVATWRLPRMLQGICHVRDLR